MERARNVEERTEEDGRRGDGKEQGRERARAYEAPDNAEVADLRLPAKPRPAAEIIDGRPLQKSQMQTNKIIGAA